MIQIKSDLFSMWRSICTSWRENNSSLLLCLIAFFFNIRQPWCYYSKKKSQQKQIQSRNSLVPGNKKLLLSSLLIGSYVQSLRRTNLRGSCRGCPAGCGWDYDTEGPERSGPRRWVRCVDLETWPTSCPDPTGCADWHMSCVSLWTEQSCQWKSP